MEQSTATPLQSIQYAYHNYGTGSSGGPLFILTYIQCAMLLVNAVFKCSMEVWQLWFPMLVVLCLIVVSIFNIPGGKHE